MNYNPLGENCYGLILKTDDQKFWYAFIVISIYLTDEEYKSCQIYMREHQIESFDDLISRAVQALVDARI